MCYIRETNIVSSHDVCTNFILILSNSPDKFLMSHDISGMLD